MSTLPVIEPCPFCFSPRVELHRNFDYVKCLSCGAGGHVFDGHPYDAIVTWNSVSRREQSAEADRQKAMTCMGTTKPARAWHFFGRLWRRRRGRKPSIGEHVVQEKKEKKNEAQRLR